MKAKLCLNQMGASWDEGEGMTMIVTATNQHMQGNPLSWQERPLYCMTWMWDAV